MAQLCSGLIQPQHSPQMASGWEGRVAGPRHLRGSWAALFPQTALTGLQGVSSDPPLLPGLRLKWERVSLSVLLSKCHCPHPPLPSPALARTHWAAAAVLQVVVPTIIALHLPGDVLLGSWKRRTHVVSSKIMHGKSVSTIKLYYAAIFSPYSFWNLLYKQVFWEVLPSFEE